MLVLTIRTDKPESEIGLYENDKQIAYETWEAHRQLAETIHKKIDELLKTNETELGALQGIVCYKGPGSFTGLRIGMSVANALSHSLKIPAVATGSDAWQAEGIQALLDRKSDAVLLPEYGGEVHITRQKK